MAQVTNSTVSRLIYSAARLQILSRDINSKDTGIGRNSWRYAVDSIAREINDGAMIRLKGSDRVAAELIHKCWELIYHIRKFGHLRIESSVMRGMSVGITNLISRVIDSPSAIADNDQFEISFAIPEKASKVRRTKRKPS